MRELIRRILAGREITMTGGRLAVDLATCPTCGAPKAAHCMSTAFWTDTPYVHLARRRDAARRLETVG